MSPANMAIYRGAVPMSVAPWVKTPPKASAVLQMRKLKPIPASEVSFVKSPMMMNMAMRVSVMAIMWENPGVQFAMSAQNLTHEATVLGCPSAALETRSP